MNVLLEHLASARLEAIGREERIPVQVRTDQAVASWSLLRGARDWRGAGLAAERTVAMYGARA